MPEPILPRRCRLGPWSVAGWVAVMLVMTAPRPAAAGEASMAMTGLGGTGGLEPEALAVVEELILAALQSHGTFSLIGRSDIEQLLGLEQQRQLLGCDEDTACLAELAGALGADYLISATLGRLGNHLVVSLRLVDVYRAHVVSRVHRTFEDESELVSGLAPLVATLLESSPAPVREHLGMIAPEPPAPDPAPGPDPEPVSVTDAITDPGPSAAASPASDPVASASPASDPAASASPPSDPAAAGAGEPISPALGRLALWPEQPAARQLAVRSGFGGHLGVFGVGVEWRPTWYGVALGSGTHLLSGGFSFGPPENAGGWYADVFVVWVRSGVLGELSGRGVGIGATGGWDLRPWPWLSVKAGVGLAWSSAGDGRWPLAWDLSVGPVF